MVKPVGGGVSRQKGTSPDGSGMVLGLKKGTHPEKSGRLGGKERTKILTV
jgi:hypothetical protein